MRYLFIPLLALIACLCAASPAFVQDPAPVPDEPLTSEAVHALAAAPTPSPSSPFVVDLEGGHHVGFVAAYDGWTGLPQASEDERFRDAQGRRYSHDEFDSLVIRGPPEKAHVFARDWSEALPLSDAAVIIGHRVRSIRFERIVFYGGARSCVFLGIDSAGTSELRPLHAEFIDCEFRDAPRKFTLWGLHTYQTSLRFERCVWELEESREHGIYIRGLAAPPGTEDDEFKLAALFESCEFRAVGAEGIKITWRPDSLANPGGKHASQGTPYVPGCVVAILNTRIQNYAQPHSWRGGAGIVIQGGACTVFVSGCVVGPSAVQVNSGKRSKPAIAMDAPPGGEWYGRDGRASAGKGNRELIVVNSLLYAENEMALRALDAGACLLAGSGVYGNGSYVRMQNMGLSGVSGCNTDDIDAAAIREGLWTENVAPVRVGKSTIGLVDQDNRLVNDLVVK